MTEPDYIWPHPLNQRSVSGLSFLDIGTKNPQSIFLCSGGGWCGHQLPSDSELSLQSLMGTRGPKLSQSCQMGRTTHS